MRTLFAAAALLAILPSIALAEPNAEIVPALDASVGTVESVAQMLVKRTAEPSYEEDCDGEFISIF